MITSALTSMRNANATAMGVMKNTIANTWTAVRSNTTTSWSSIKGTITSNLTEIRNTVRTAMEFIKNTVSTAMSEIRTAVSTGMNSLKSTVSTELGSIRSSFSSTFSGLVGSAYSWGADICGQMASGIRANSGSVLAEARSLASQIDDIIGFSVPETGPLSHADEYMPDFMELLARGIKSGMGRCGQPGRNGSVPDPGTDGEDPPIGNGVSAAGSPGLSERRMGRLWTS